MYTGGEARKMSVRRRVAVCMVEKDEIAEAVFPMFLLNRSGAGSHHRRARRHGEIDASARKPFVRPGAASYIRLELLEHFSGAMARAVLFPPSGELSGGSDGPRP